MGFGAEIYLDGNFKPGTANVEYYNITGVKNYVNIFTKMICDRDRENVENLIKGLSVGEKTHTMFRLEYEDENSNVNGDFFAEIIKEDDEQTFLRFYPADSFGEIMQKSELDLKKYKSLLSSDKDIYFDYYFENGIIETYTINHDHVTTKDKTTITAWKERLISNGTIKEVDISKFNAMCSNIESGKSVSCLFETGTSKNFFLHIKAKPIFMNAEKNFMTGIITHIEKDTAASAEDKNNDIDDLTGLYRKNVIRQIEEDAINNAISESSEKILSIVMVDIDNFKTVNDNYGHQFGDKVIYKISSTLKDVVGDYGHCGRFGGDELCAFIDNVENTDQIRGILRTLKARVNGIVYNEYPSLKVTVSIGEAAYPINGTNFDTIFKKADRALYMAKEKGRNRYVIYDNELHGELIEDAGGNKKRTVSMTDKTEFTNFLSDISKFLYSRGKDGVCDALKMIYDKFMLDRVQFYILEDGRYKNFYKFGDALEKTPEYADFIDEQYITLFKNDTLAMNFTYNIEFIHPSAYKALSDEKVFSAVQCLARNREGNIIGLCSFEHLSYKKMFAQNELTIYSYITSMIGVIIS